MNFEHEITPFTKYKLTADQHKKAFEFSPETVAMLQNEITVAATAKIALQYDPSNPLRFAQQEADLAGRIAILTYLLDCYKAQIN